jgi:periplasmic protein TonB
MTEARQALVRGYPPLLRDAGIGGTARVWVYIDQTGAVQRMQLSGSSGHDALDRAALDVAGSMKFSPARNRDEVVSVWIELPIVFSPPDA